MRLGQDAHKIIAGEVGKFHTNGESALQFGHQVAGAGFVERAGRDEQDVIGVHRPVLGVHRRTLNDRQQVTLNARPADIRAVAAFGTGDLVDLVEENDTRLLGALDGIANHLVAVDEFVGLLVEDELAGGAEGKALGIAPGGHHLLQHVLHVRVEVQPGLAEHVAHGRLFVGADLHHAVFQGARAKLFAQLIPRPLVAGLGFLIRPIGRVFAAGQEVIQQAILHLHFGGLAHLLHHLDAGHVQGNIQQVADHGLDIPAVISHLGVFGGLDFKKRGVDQAGEPAGDFGLAHAR